MLPSNRVADRAPGKRPEIEAGQGCPLGATLCPEGANFSVFSTTGVDLPFFDGADDPRPARVISVDPAANHTYHYSLAFERFQHNPVRRNSW